VRQTPISFSAVATDFLGDILSQSGCIFCGAWCFLRGAVCFPQGSRGWLHDAKSFGPAAVRVLNVPAISPNDEVRLFRGWVSAPSGAVCSPNAKM